MALRGATELKRAISGLFKDAGKSWADDTALIAKGMVPVRTGHTRSSIRRRNASQRKATVVGWYPVNFIDAGTRAHDITPKNATVLRFNPQGQSLAGWKQAGSQTVFAKKVHKRATSGNKFKSRAAQEGLRKHPILPELVAFWNKTVLK